MAKFYLIFVGVSPNSRIIFSIRFATVGKLLVKLTLYHFGSFTLNGNENGNRTGNGNDGFQFLVQNCTHYTLTGKQCTGGINEVDCIASSLEKLCLIGRKLKLDKIKNTSAQRTMKPKFR